MRIRPRSRQTMAAATQCNNRKLLQWGLVLMLLSVLSVSVGIFKGASWAIGVSAAMSVLLFMLLFVIVFTKTADSAGTGSASITVAQKEFHCIWAACKFRELQASCVAHPIFNIVCVTSDQSNRCLVVCRNLATVDRRPPAKISCQRACACCLDDYHLNTDVALLPCGHAYHQECIARWCFSSVKKVSCPTCRKPFEHTEATMTSL